MRVVLSAMCTIIACWPTSAAESYICGFSGALKTYVTRFTLEGNVLLNEDFGGFTGTYALAENSSRGIIAYKINGPDEPGATLGFWVVIINRTSGAAVTLPLLDDGPMQATRGDCKREDIAAPP